MSEGSVHITVRMPLPLVRLLDAAAKRTDLSRSKVLLRCVRRQLEKADELSDDMVRLTWTRFGECLAAVTDADLTVMAERIQVEQAHRAGLLKR